MISRKTFSPRIDIVFDMFVFARPISQCRQSLGVNFRRFLGHFDRPQGQFSLGMGDSLLQPLLESLE